MFRTKTIIHFKRRTLTVVFASILFLFIVPLLTSTQAAGLSTSPTGLIISLYTYPGTTWDQVAAAKKAHPSVPIIAIINPASGPGTSIDTKYVTGIQELKSAGVIVLGYVYTSYASRNMSSVIDDIDTYKKWYPVDGIKFDQMANTPGFESYYSNLTAYAKSQGFTFTVGNPGTDTIPSYIGTVDNMIIYEGPGLPTIPSLAGWHTSYDKSNFSAESFGISTLDEAAEFTESQYLGYMYITNDILPNPYDSIPPYLSTEVAVLDTSSTTAPRNLQATSGIGNATLVWQAPLSNGGSTITGYQIYRSTSSGTGTIYASIGNLTSFTDTLVTGGTKYFYKVSALNGTAYASPRSNEASAIPLSVSQPPTGLATPYVSPSQISISWQAPLNDGGSPITGYKIERSIDGGTTWNTIAPNVAPSPRWYSDYHLLASTTYTYRVSAINSIGTSSPSSTVSVTVSQPPTGLKATTVSPSQINLSCIAPTSNDGSAITGYKIERSTDGGTTWNTIVASTLHSWYSDYFLSASTTYTYRVSAINAIGTSLPSSTASATTSPATVSDPPRYLTPTVVSPSQINLSWWKPVNSGGSPITGYQIERSTDGGTTWNTIVANTGSALYINHYSNYFLSASTAYTYRVSTINAIGTSAPSSTASATTSPATVPDPPRYLNATVVSPSQINLSWWKPVNSGGSAITGYQIERSTDGGTTWNTIVANTGSAGYINYYSNIGLLPSTTYTYQVSAINAIGTSSPSGTVSATT